jgi:hypothetical protein
MVFCGQIVVKNVVLERHFFAAENSSLFPGLFFAGRGDGQLAATPGKPAHTPGTLSVTR